MEHGHWQEPDQQDDDADEKQAARGEHAGEVHLGSRSGRPEHGLAGALLDRGRTSLHEA